MREKFIEAAQVDQVMRFFRYDHLPPSLQEISAPFGDLALKVYETLPRNNERTKTLNKLLEAKDAAVRAFIFDKAIEARVGDPPVKRDPAAGPPIAFEKSRPIG